MPLITCGIVVEQKGSELVIESKQERCEQCPGNCVRFKNTGLIKVTGSLPVGTRVEVRASATKFALASTLVFGPVPVVFVLMLWLNPEPSLGLTTGMLLLAILLSGLIARLTFGRFLHFLVEPVR